MHFPPVNGTWSRGKTVIGKNMPRYLGLTINRVLGRIASVSRCPNGRKIGVGTIERGTYPQQDVIDRQA